MTSKTLCPYPFVHQHIDPDGEIKACCAIAPQNVYDENGKKFNVQTHTLDDEWNSPYKRKLRLDLINGEKPDVCNHCWVLEDETNTKGKSVRFESMARIPKELYESRVEYAKQHDGYLDDLPIDYQTMTGNLCNLACKMCQPRFSSNYSKFYQNKNYTSETEIKFVKGYDDFFVHGENSLGVVYDWPKKQTLLKIFEGRYQTIKTLFLTGGEPTIIDDNLDFLQYLIDNGYSKNIELGFVSNATNLNKRFFNIVTKFRSLNMVVSLDGMDEIAYIQRHPSNWNQVEKNVKELHNLTKANPDNFWISARSVLTALNLHQIPKFWNYINENYNIPISFIPIYNEYGSYASLNFGISLVPQQIIEELKKEVELLKQNVKNSRQQQVYEMLEYELNNNTFAEDFTKIHDMLDNMQKLHPELDIKQIYSIYYKDRV
jgi:organic radical activating enzyme